MAEGLQLQEKSISILREARAKFSAKGGSASGGKNLAVL